MTTIAEAFTTIRPDLSRFGPETEQGIKRSLDSITGSLLGAGATLTAGVTAPIMGIGIAASRSAMTFESAFTGVIKTVDATAAELDMLRSGILDMSRGLPASAASIADVAMSAGQLGIQVPNILDFTRVMIDLGEATNLTAQDAATQLARFANITQMSQQDFDRLGSSVVALGNNLATTEAEIVSFGLRIAGAGAQVGLSEDQILAWAGALSSVGVEAEAGGTAISRVFIDIANAVADGGGKLNQFAQIAGMTSGEFSRAFREDASRAVMTFVEGLGRLSASGANVFGILDDLSLGNIRVRDALLRSSGAGELLRQALALSAEAWEENLALTREAELRYGTAESRLAMLRNEIDVVAITLGDALVPVLLRAVDLLSAGVPVLEAAARVFAELPEPVQFFAIGLAAIAAAAGPALIMIGGMGVGFTALKVSAVAATAALTGFNLAMLANPVTAALMVGGLAVGALAFGTIKGAMDEATRSAERYAQIQTIVGTSSVDQVRREIDERERLRFSLLEQVGAMEAAGVTTFEHERQLSRLFERISLTEGQIGVLREALTELERQERLTASQTEEARRLIEDLGGGAIDTANDLAKLTPQIVAAGVASKVMGLWMSETLPPMAGMALGFKALVDGIEQVKRVAEEQAALEGLTNAILGAAGATDIYERAAADRAATAKREFESARREAEKLAREAEKAATEAARAWDTQLQDTLRGIDTLGRQVVTAMQRQHEAALNDSLRAIERERDARMDAHNARLAQIDRERDAALAAIDAQLAALTQATSDDRLRELQSQLALAYDPREQRRIQQQITDLQRSEESRRLQDSRRAVETGARTRTEAAKEDLRRQMAALDEQVKQARSAYDDVTQAWKLEARARELIAAGELDAITGLIKAHVPEWQRAWQSFGEGVVNGPLASIRNEVGRINGMLAAVGGAGSGAAVNSPVGAQLAALQRLGQNAVASGTPAWALQNTRDQIRALGGVPSFAVGGFARVPQLAVIGDRPGGEHVFGDDQLRRVIREETTRAGAAVIEVHTHTYLDGRHIDERIERYEAYQQGRGARLQGGR